jgi:FkbM family methyltransferase
MEYTNIKATISKRQYLFLFYYILLKLSFFLGAHLIKKEKEWKIWNTKIITPPSVHAYWVIIEVFFINLYKKISWYETVLDLWWFIGESALYLSNQNKKVVVIESDPLHYWYLEKNCKSNPRITTLFWAAWIIAKEVFVHKRNSVDSCNQVSENQKEQSIVVPSFHIESLLSQYRPDVIKMDIEWWEYDIMDRLMHNKDYFSFKAWIIEYHFFEKTKEINIELFLKFLNFLDHNKYTYIIFDNNNKVIKIKEIKKYNVIACNIYFYLLP